MLENKEVRLRAIAMNAIREARVANGRPDDPFSDDDAARAESIFQLLHVQSKTEVDQQYEHFPLVNTENTKVSPTVVQVSEILGKSAKSLKVS